MIKKKNSNFIKGVQKKPKFKQFAIFAFLFLFVGLVYASTVISDTGVSSPTGTYDNLISDKLTPKYIRNAITDNLSDYMSGTILNELRYSSVNGTVDNTDIFTIRSDTYSDDYNDATPYGFRNLVSRVNSYSHTDSANIYSVWNNYAGGQGANTWLYSYEHPCNDSYYNCSDTTSRTMYGQVIRFGLIQNSTNKEGLRIENTDPNKSKEIDKGIRLLGNFTTGIKAESSPTSTYSNAFIDADGQDIKDARIKESRSISVVSSDITNNVLIDGNGVLSSNNAMQYILNDAVDQTTGAGLLWVRDARAGSTRPMVRLQDVGSGSPLLIVSNSTAVTCDATNAGGIYYDGTTNKHRGCDGTNWNDLY